MAVQLTFKRVQAPLSHISFSKRILCYSTTSVGALSKSSRKPNKFIVYCNSLISKHGRNGNLKQSESIFNRMPAKSIISWTAMLTAYAENGQIEKARKLFDDMPERNVASWNAMITAYIRNKNGTDEAYQLFLKMPERNVISYTAMVTGFVQAGMFDKAKKLCSETPLNWRDPVCSNALMSGYLKVGKLEEAVRVFEAMLEKDVVSWSSMVDGFCKNDRIDEAKSLFDRMPERNVVTWTAMIDGYMKIGSFEHGFGLFLQMRQENIVKVEVNTLTVIFEACGRFGRYREGCQVHCLIICMGFAFDTFSGNSVIGMYCRFGCIDAAVNIFGKMDKKDVVSWNSLVAGYIQADDIEEAFRVFEVMPDKDVVSWTTMITGFSARGLTRKCIELFKIMPYKDDVAWTALITGFVTNGEHEEAFYWFIQMLREPVVPNPFTLSTVLSASASMASLNQGLQVHAYVLKMDMKFDLSIQNSLVSMYSKCGSVEDAYRIFNRINAPNVVSFNSMITGYAQNGFGIEALVLFQKMLDEDRKPNDITFLTVLSACTHAGLIEEGKKYFNFMRLYKIEPGPDHYACMVDLLGRAGLLDEAANLIQSMPFNPNPGVWGALLGAARLHLCADIAKIAAKHLSELEPSNAVPYVVLSDIYSVAGRKHEEEQMRIAKRVNGIKKIPGCSWILVKDKVDVFCSGDKSHINFEEIRSTLGTILDGMKQLKGCLLALENQSF